MYFLIPCDYLFIILICTWPCNQCKRYTHCLRINFDFYLELEKLCNKIRYYHWFEDEPKNLFF